MTTIEQRDIPLVGGIGQQITPGEVRELLEPPGPVRLWLASEGGDHAAGVAIYHIIRERPGVTVHVVRAASAAVLVAVAADHRTIAADGRMLVHRGVTLAAGTAADLYEAAERMAKLDRDYLAVLTERTGCADLEARLDAAGGEWWLTPTEAVECGFVSAITSGEPDGWTPPALDPARNTLVRAEVTLRRRMKALTDDDAWHKAVTAREAAAEVSADYRAGLEAHAHDFGQAVEQHGLAALALLADEALRRVTDRTRKALADTRRQLSVLDLGGKPTAPTATPWLCATCGNPNFHEPGDWRELAACFSCDKERI